MVTASGRPFLKNGNKRPMPPNTLVRNRSIVGRTPVLGHGALKTYSIKRSSPARHMSLAMKSGSICGPCWAPKPVNSGGIPFDTFKHMDDGWGASREPPPTCSSRSTLHAAIILATVSRCKLFQGARGHAEDLKNSQAHVQSFRETGCIVFTKTEMNRETKCGVLCSETPICRI